MTLIGLSEAVKNLRQELLNVQEQGETEKLKFNIELIEIELEVVAEKEAGGHIKWLLIPWGAGAETKFKDISKHKIKFNLQVIDTSSGKQLQVSARQTTPPK